MTALDGETGLASTEPVRGGTYQRRGRARRDQQGRSHPFGDNGDARGGSRRRGSRGSHSRAGRDEDHTQLRSSMDGTVEEPPPPLPPPPLIDGVAASSTGPGKETGQAEDGANGEVEGDICFICASLVVHHSVAPCNHRTCHICALRLRALYKTNACAHCRTVSEYVVFTDEKFKRFEEYTLSDFAKTDSKLGIKYEKLEIFEDTVLLLQYNCPDPNCDVACHGWSDLHRHVRSVHHRIMCELCTRNKKVFTHEHELFTSTSLRKHEKFGDDNPGAVDQSGFKGHPECGFCRQRFYGDDELYTHCRDKHERCHICDRRNQNREQQYYVDYGALEAHFKKDHFLCSEQECLDKKFVVFDSEMDLKAHRLETHPLSLSKDARRDARRVDMSGFAFRAPHEQERAERREGRGRARGRDPTVEPLPQSSAQPLRRDELAFQRQIAVHSAQNAASRPFGGQLSSMQTQAARVPNTTIAPTATNPSRSEPAVGRDNFPSLPSTPSHQTSTLSPQEQARRLRHNAVTERAASLLRNDTQKLSEFRTRVSEYRNSSISAGELLDIFMSLFDTSSAELGKLVKELAEIFEIVSKRSELLKAWADWKAKNEDYPSLPGANGGPAGSVGEPLGHGGMRVLKLKSSTAQSSRSAVSRQGSWGAVTGADNSFPALPPSRNPAGRGGTSNSVPWVASVPSRPAPSSSASTASRAGPSNTLSRNNVEAFPALPAAAKPTSTLFTPGYSGNAVRRPYDGRSAATNVWNSNGFSAGSSQSAVANEDEEVGLRSANGKSKGKNKKQTLLHFG